MHSFTEFEKTGASLADGEGVCSLYSPLGKSHADFQGLKAKLSHPLLLPIVLRNNCWLSPNGDWMFDDRRQSVELQNTLLPLWHPTKQYFWPGNSWTVCCLTHQATKLDGHGSTPASSGNAVYNTSHEHRAQIFMVSTFATFPPFFQPTSRNLWGVPYDQLTKTEKFKLALKMVLHKLAGSESRWLLHHSLTWRWPKRQSGEGISCQQEELPSSAPGYSFLYRRRESNIWNYISSRAMTNGLVGWSGTWKNTT